MRRLLVAYVLSSIVIAWTGGCLPEPTCPSTVTIRDDADMADFATRDCITIAGDLIVRGTALETVEMLTLQRIEGRLIIEDNESLRRFSSPALSALSGSLLVTENPGLAVLELGAIRDVRCSTTPCAVHGSGLTTLDLGTISTVEGDLSIATNGILASLDLGGLAEVTGSLTLEDNPVLSELDLNSLVTVGGSLLLAENDSLPSLELGALQTVGGSLELTRNAALSRVDLSALVEAGSITLRELPSLTSIDLGSLVSVTGALVVENNLTLEEVVAPLLVTIGGDVVISDNPALTDVVSPAIEAAQAGPLPDGLVLYWDAANTNSYPGSGTTWTDLSGRGNNGSIIGDEISYSPVNGGALYFAGTPIYDDNQDYV